MGQVTDAVDVIGGAGQAPEGDVVCAVADDVATLTLTRPRKHNALTNHMWLALTQHVERLNEDPAVRLIVVRGHGDVFSAGADLAEVAAACGDEAEAVAFCRRVVDALLALACSPKLTVAALSHHVTGGGAELALACDVRVADSTVLFQIPVARLGLVPDRLTVRRLLQIGGPGAARSVLLLSRQLDAEALHRLGLIDELVGPGELDQALAAVLDTLRLNSELAVRTTKQILLDEEGVGSPEDLIAEFVASLMGGDVGERAQQLLRRTANRAGA
ncbi:enoyl-CoA hydratase/isomerase family protein [Ornithinimicrobium cavernae]|uniref:enoyl-CoA hydratase/isomerase family protein n=1 Tax=Ornithinimicrobium cavernae TaxID=2666047 RepID=UPI000D68D98F|nr:enoyl-CoA hydratase/isomerase family protein [Ornithinimicrobium cavernae]